MFSHLIHQNQQMDKIKTAHYFFFVDGSEKWFLINLQTNIEISWKWLVLSFNLLLNIKILYIFCIFWFRALKFVNILTSYNEKYLCDITVALIITSLAFAWVVFHLLLQISLFLLNCKNEILSCWSHVFSKHRFLPVC